jgi:hypothetical protein
VLLLGLALVVHDIDAHDCLQEIMQRRVALWNRHRTAHTHIHTYTYREKLMKRRSTGEAQRHRDRKGG